MKYVVTEIWFDQWKKKFLDFSMTAVTIEGKPISFIGPLFKSSKGCRRQVRYTL